MLGTFVAAALAAIPAVSAQLTVSDATTVCETRYGVYSYTGSSVSTYRMTLDTTLTKTFEITRTTQSTVTITPSATATSTDFITVTVTETTTTSVTPPASTVRTPSKFFPIVNTALVAPTSLSRVKARSIEARGQHEIDLSKLPVGPGNTSGYIINRNGTSGTLNQVFPYRVICTIQNILNITNETTVTGPDETVTLTIPTATAEATTTLTVSETVTEIEPTPTVYAACQANNVVNSIRDTNNEFLYFDRLIFAQNDGLPIASSLVIPATDGEACCIICQETSSCAGSFFVPSESNCHLRLNQPPAPLPSTLSLPTLLPEPTITQNPGNSTLLRPIALLLERRQDTTATESDLAPAPPTSTPTPYTCPAGSRTQLIGFAHGSESFPPEIALMFSNGPCGRFIPVNIPIEQIGTNDPTMLERNLSA